MGVWAYHEPRGSPCALCGLTRGRHRVRHAPGCDCGASHKGARSPSDRRRTRKARRFTIGLDGEGLGRAPHRYTLLAWSDASGERSDYLEDLRGLSTAACLAFLCELPIDAHVCGYYLGYDWTMILRDLPNRALYRLYRPELRALPGDEGSGFSPVRYDAFELHWLGGMMRVRPRGRKRWTTIWDVGKFYQCRFVDALADAKIGTPEELERMRDMKDRRSQFDESEAPQIRAYCLDECAKLAALVEQLNDGHEAAELALTSWYGPGSAAAVLLKKLGIKDKRGETPDEMRVPIASAFFGGRFEHSTFGEIDGPIFSGDIVSAYLAEAVRLPCLEHATWRYTEREADLESAEQACVRFELIATIERRAWGPLPIRQHDGTIVYPRSGASGWTWLREFRAARRWPQVCFRGAWILERACDCVPFAEVQTAFDARIALGKKTAVGLAIKRTLASLYGKLAQAVGNPPFRSQVWAGMITSGCRAQLLDVLWCYDDAIVAVATDGVYSRAPLDLNEGAQLGQWEVEEHDRIVLVRPGIYWTESDIRSRGLPRATIAAEKESILHAIRHGWSKCVLPPITQFGAARATIYRLDSGVLRRSPRYGEWFERPAMVSFDPAPKRRADWSLWDLDGIESAPYSPHRLSADARALKDATALAECG